MTDDKPHAFERVSQAEMAGTKIVGVCSWKISPEDFHSDFIFRFSLSLSLFRSQISLFIEKSD